MITNLEAIETAIKVTATVVIPLAGVWIANKFTKSVRERELSTKYIEIAVDILKEQPIEQQAALRQWALDVINHYSEIQLSNEAQETLVRDAPLTTERLEGEKLFEWQKSYYDKFTKR